MSAGKLDVAVVGGGAAGLSAAWRLVRGGAAVTLYETRERLGGQLRTIELDGVRCDVGVQLLASYYAATLELAEQTGAAALLRGASGKDALWRGGRRHGVEYGSPTSMLLSSVLPTTLKLRLATRYIGFLGRHAAELDPVEFATRAIRLDGESIAQWGERELDRNFVELLVYPTLAAYYGSTPEETGAPFFHALARGGMSVRLISARGGMGELATAIGEGLSAAGARIMTECAVESVERGGEEVVVRWGAGEARHDAAVLALPPRAVPPLLGAQPEPLRWLEGVRTRPTAALALLLDREVPGDYFGLSFPRLEAAGDRVSALCVQERKNADLVPRGRSAVVVFPAPHRAQWLAGAEPTEVLELLLPALETALPGIRGRVQRARVIRFPQGGVIFYPGYLRHLAAYRDEWLGPRLALAGDYFVAPTVEGAVRSGQRAAALLLERRAGGGL